MINRKYETNSTRVLQPLKRAWLMRFIFIFLVVAVGGCLVVEGNENTLIEKLVGSLIIALLATETAAIINYFNKKPAFILSAYLFAKALGRSYSID